MNVAGQNDPTIFDALVAFQSEMPTVTRETEGQAGQRKYKYADLTAIVKEATPLLTKNGLAFVCQPRRTDDGTYETVGVLVHTSGGTIEGSLPIFGRTPQEIGSSLTYNRRYLLGNLTGIVTDEDDDVAAANARPQQTRRQQSPLDVAKNKVAAVWRDTHGGVFDREALRDDYQQRFGLDIDNANAVDLNAYAQVLTAPAADEAFERALGAQPATEQEQA